MTVATLEAPAPIVPADPFDLLPRGAVVAVAMSGGVDSSVAAARCVARGVTTWGVTLAMWAGDREQVRDRGCCSVDAVEDARRVADRLGIRHLTWNLESEFAAEVITGFEDDYASGRTPNPCVRCNQRVKFGVLLARARAIGATHVATGHYARIGRRAESWTLHRASEVGKDQSYTLHRLDQAQLGAALLPLGDVGRKADVRAEAAALGLGTAAKPDSQELCFVGDDLAGDLSRRLAGRFQPGPIVDGAGRVLGEHRGLPFYTVGQRGRLGIAPDRPDAVPLYVLELDAAANRVVVGPAGELGRSRLTAGDCRWVGGRPPEGGGRVEAQLRAHGRAHPAEVIGAGGRSVELRFPEPVGQVSPGQSVVLYRGDEALGGGVVEAASV
ncbi:MAG: tRNA 2-thiouridine(34) synthase MnmA [Candidatus Dormibacteria bacterium]